MHDWIDLLDSNILDKTDDPKLLLFMIQFTFLTLIILDRQMILKTVCAFLAFLLELFGVYGDGEFKWYYGYVSLMHV